MYLVSKVLGSDDPRKNLWGLIHKRIADKLKELQHECLILIPRGHLKSTLVTQGWVTQQLLINPRLRVLISSADKDKALAFVGAIQENFKGPKFVERFGDLLSEDNQTMDHFNMKGKTPGTKEFSVQAASIGTDMTSQHYDLIVLDDMVNRKMSTSDDQRTKVANFYMDCLDLLEPDGRIVLIGTRWHFGDLYSKLLKESEDNKERFDFVINEAALINPKYSRKQFKEMFKDKDTLTLFPEKFDMAAIKSLYLKKLSKPGGEYEFSCQQMNYPVSDSKAAFKFEELEFVSRLPLSTTLYLCCDPAGADEIKKDNDDTAIAVVAIDINGDIYNVDMFAERTTPDEVFRQMYSYYMRYPNARKIGLETNFNKSNTLYIREKYPDMARKLHEYRMSNVKDAKKRKMLGLQPYVANGKFKILEHEDGQEYVIGDKKVKLYPGQYKLIEQMVDFGTTQHDDALDAQASALEFLQRPVRVSGEVEEYIPDNSVTGY